MAYAILAVVTALWGWSGIVGARKLGYGDDPLVWLLGPIAGPLLLFIYVLERAIYSGTR